MTREEKQKAIYILKNSAPVFPLKKPEEYNDYVQTIKQVIDWLEQESQIRPKGHWYIDERPESNRKVICSNCEQPIFKYHKLNFDYRPKYCPNCGADMKEVEE